MTNLTMVDSIDVAALPSTGMDAVLGYVGGRWPTYAALVKRFPHLPALSVAVNSTQDAQCLDVEAGDATPAQVPGWLDRQARLHPNRIPILYCAASQVAAVQALAGKRRHLIFSAHYGAGPHICGSGGCKYPRVDATQWDDHGPHGEHYDRSLMTPAFLAAFAPPKPKVPVVVKVVKAIVQVSRSVVRKVVPVRHDTGLNTEKPWGAFPLRAGEWYGVNDGTPHSHSGLAGADIRRVKQIQREVRVAPDGSYGPKTALAVVAYQRRRKIVPADGAVGPHTWSDMTTHD